MHNKWIRRLLPLIILAGAAVIALALVRCRPELPQRESVPKVPLVEVMTAAPGPVAVAVHSRGTVAASMDIELVTEVSGKVIWVAPEFVAGGAVAQGTTLLRIDPIDYEVALSAAQADLASAKLSLAEVQAVVKKAAIEEAEARVRAAQDRLRHAEADLANTVIAVPFDAVIDTRQVDLGQYVQAGSPLMRLLGTELVEVRLPLLASDVPFTHYGQRADGSWPEATLTARFGDIERSWPARLARLEQRVDAQTRVFYLVAQVEAPYDSKRHPWPLSVGLFVEADIGGVEIHEATRIPRSALYDGDSVYVLEQDSMRKRPVTVLRRERDSIIVGAGLAAGDKLILSRLEVMTDGMPAAAVP